MKQCNDCQIEKPASEFHAHKFTRDRLHIYCKPCFKERQKNLRKAARIEAIGHYSNGTMSCRCCGEKTLDFLDLDHVDGGGRQDRISNKNTHTSLLVKKRGYPPGFQVLCRNCNWAKHLYGACPYHAA